MKAPTAAVEVLLPLRNKTSQQVEDFLKNELQRKGKGSLPVNKSVGGFSAPFLISTLHDITPTDFQASKRSHKKTQTPNSRKYRITNMPTQSVLILTVPLHCIPYACPIHSRYQTGNLMEDTTSMKLVLLLWLEDGV